MSSQAQKFKIGLFVVTSFMLMTGVLIWLGATRMFERSKPAVAYFTESVQGLEADSPVKFRGVRVGRVKAIRMAPGARLIEVLMSLDKNFKISEDLGVKMNLLGLTGQKYLEMDTSRPEQQAEPIQLEFTPEYPVIATYSSDIREIGNALEKLFQKMNAVDVDRISNNFVRVSSRLEKILADPKLDTVGTDVALTIKEVKETARKFNDEVTRAQVARGINRTFDQTHKLLADSTETMQSLNKLIRGTDFQLKRVTGNLDRVSENLIKFTQRLNEAPLSTIFWGGGPEKQEKKK